MQMYLYSVPFFLVRVKRCGRMQVFNSLWCQAYTLCFSISLSVSLCQLKRRHSWEQKANLEYSHLLEWVLVPLNRWMACPARTQKDVEQFGLSFCLPKVDVIYLVLCPQIVWFHSGLRRSETPWYIQMGSKEIDSADLCNCGFQLEFLSFSRFLKLNLQYLQSLLLSNTDFFFV